MTSSTDTPEEVRPLTQEELAVQCAHDGLDLLTEANAKLVTAWPDLPLGMRAALFGNVEAMGEAERSMACILAGGER